jgi:hypothetical protein
MAKLPPPPAKAIEAGTGAPNGALFLLRGAETPVGRLELFARDIGDCPGIGGSFYVKVAIALETTRFSPAKSIG